MNENKRYQLRQEQLDYPIVNFYSDLVDTENNDKVICSFDNDVGTSKMVDLLNELSEENEQLKQSFDKSLLNHTKTCDEYRILSKKNKRLTEENEELKQEIEEHKAVINREWNKYLKKHEMI